MGLNTWWHLFRPENGAQHPGGLDSLTRGVVARIFDDFEDYADAAALQAVWTETGGAGNPTLTTAANAVRGSQSMQVAVAGADGTVYRAINPNFFGFPAPGRIRYLAFKAVVSAGATSDSIVVRLSDASDATLYREWTLTVAQQKTQEFIIDLYSGSTTSLTGGGFLNTESYVGPTTEGATAWDHTLIDRLTFGDLTDGLTYRFDDIRFFYEYSLLDALGFGTEPATDDGADGSIHSKLRYLNNQVLQLVGSTEVFSKFGPPVAYLNYNYTFGLELLGYANQGIPSTTEIDPGNYRIDRVRNGTTIEIVASTGASESAGFIYATYQPLEDNWQPGDEMVVEFSGGSIYNDTDDAVTLTGNAASGQAVVTVADASLFQVGQQVRIYDDTPDTEYGTVLTVDSPTQFTLSANLSNDYTTAQNAAVILVQQTTLSLARYGTSVTYEPELDREQKRWVLADYDDFDAADADGNTERWDVGYISNTDGSAAGAEGGSADIDTTTAGKLYVAVDPDGTPTQAAYAAKRDEPSYSRYFTVAVDANVAIDSTQATASYAGLRVSSGDADDASNYVLVAREVSSGQDRIATLAEFGGVAQTPVYAAITDTSVAFKIERYGNVWNVFYSLTQYPNWQWVKVTQFEDASGDMTGTTSCYLYTESGGSADEQTALADFDNWRYYIGSGAIDQILSTLVVGSGTFTASSTTVPADTGRTEENDFWNGHILMPVTGSVAFQARAIVDFANAGGVFTIDGDQPYTTAPAIGDEYVLLVDQIQLEPGTDSTNNQTAAHVVGSKADTVDYTYNATTSSLVRLVKGILGVEVIAEGTFTTSSATVPADTGRLEANDYWNGSWLMPVAGSRAFQPRLIVDFANAGGVFTVDADQPFTGVTGTVDYVILSRNGQLAPAADSASNQTPAHVVGNKSDAADVTAGTASVIARIRGIEAALSVNAATGGEFEIDGSPDLWDALVVDSSSDGDITSMTGDRDGAVIERMAAVENALGIVNAAAPGAGFEEDGTGATLYNVLVAVEGVTSGAGTTTTFVDAARTEGLDYWNGNLVVSLSGAAAGQIRTIVDDDGAGTLTIEPLLSAAPGTPVAYVILNKKSADWIVGDNNASNAFASGNVTADVDGSVLERLEAIQTALGVVAAAGGEFEADGDPDLWDILVTGYDSSAVTENGDGSVLERLEEIRGASSTATHNVEVANGINETTVVNLSPIRHGVIAVELDLDTLVVAGEGGTVIVRLKNMIDGVVLRTIDRADFLVGTDEVHPTVSGFVQEGTTTARVTIQVNDAVTAQRAVPYRIIEGV